MLEGSVRKAGNRVRISAQLIDGATNNHLWAERYDRDLEDIFAVQDEITQVVAGAIEPEITKAEFERAYLKPPDDLDAWSIYQQGMHHFHLGTSEGEEVARRLFREAIERAPGFSAPTPALPGHIPGRRASRRARILMKEKRLPFARRVPPYRLIARTPMRMPYWDSQSKAAPSVKRSPRWNGRSRSTPTRLSRIMASAVCMSFLGSRKRENRSSKKRSI